MDLRFVENIIIKSILSDRSYLSLVSSTLEDTFFDDPAAKRVFKFVAEHYNQYQQMPQRDMIIGSAEDDEGKTEIRNLLEEIASIDFDSAAQFEFLVDSTEAWLKDKAIKQAILKSVDTIDRQQDYVSVRNFVEDALAKSIKIDLGLDYFEHLGVRLRRILQATDIRVPSYYPVLDDYVNGGFPPYTLSVFVAAIHRFKSNMMANMAARQVLHGHNVFLLTLEMSELAFAQRFDSIYSNLDINRMYMSETYIRQLKDKLAALKNGEGRGNLFIKEFPTGAASVQDFRTFLREMGLRDRRPDIIYVDYINLMRSAMKTHEGMYSSVKRVAEELRALSFEFNAPVVSVSQLNREGSFVEFNELNFNYIAESIGLPATADFMAIFGTDEDNLVYQNELHYKIVKNRLGGRVGETDKLYYDSRTLKMYDASEEDMWIQDARETGDERASYEPPEQPQRGGRRRR